MATKFEGGWITTSNHNIKKWVIVTEISKEDENNNITRLNVYSKYYVPRRPRVGEVGRSAGPGDGGVGGSHSGGGSSGRS